MTDSNVWRSQQKEQGACVNCTSPIVPGHIYCERHLESRNKYERIRYAARRGQGRCPRCNRFMAGGLYLCPECLKRRDWEHRRQYTSEERRRRIEQHRCLVCGKPLTEDERAETTRCYACITRQNGTM